jgi:signal transduction histidine kinase
MALEAAANVLKLNPASAAERIRQAVDDLDGTIREIRTTVFALQQPADSAGSVRAQVLEAVGTAAGALGFAPSVRFDGPVDTTIGDEHRDHLLAVLREALSNAARHARATEVSVVVSAREDLRLVVADNGVGLPGGGRRSGLANLAARAAQLGGTFVTEAADPGTVLVWRVPLRAR